MPVKKNIPETSGIYSITFTCTNWLSLFEIANAYSSIYYREHHLVMVTATCPITNKSLKSATQWGFIAVMQVGSKKYSLLNVALINIIGLMYKKTGV